MQAILPLAGKGTRLRPHTHTTPKPLLRVGNRTVLDRVLDLLEGAGVDEIIGIMGHLSGRIEEHLAAEHPELGFRPVMQTQQLGTADAIRLAEPHVEGPVLIVFVDTLFQADMDLIQRRPDVDGIVWAKEVEDYQRFGVIVHDDDGFMQEIIEKPSEPVSRLANIGLYYIRNVDLLFEGIEHVMRQSPKLGEYFLTDAFQYMIDNGGKLLTAEVAEWWDCGKPETLIDTNHRVLRAEATPPPAAFPGVSFVDPVRIGEGVTLEEATIGPNVSIADGSTVRRSRIRDSIVGVGSEISDCELRQSLIGDHAFASGVRGTVSLGDHSEVRGEST
ncbi:MAG: sugar phosphate nucleotidyltransferase [marine benthic group bacterium]|jgi:glucose-1-phosphate thymidylyltransferase|nr:sugar phosphate nucleotidyltransferase [Gemmatimonadota bacterium]